MQFFELLQIAVGNRDRFSHTPTMEEWRGLFVSAQKQAMLGVAFRGVERLPEEQRPHKSLLMQWYMATERVKARNADMDRKTLAVANKFLAEGFRSLVLKGQGMAQLYKLQGEEMSLAAYRMSGDIDIWLEGKKEDIIGYIRGYVPECKPVYHHVDFPVADGVDIEVHFTPSWMNSPFTNRRLQHFFGAHAFATDEAQEVAYQTIPVPDMAFNRVYILVHIYRHLFAEGIGLRQLLDYYFVLLHGFTDEERNATMEVLRSLKMERFAKAVMWVLHHVFGLKEEYMLAAPDAKDGRFLLDEIMQAGNFGQHDERMQYEQGESALHWGLRKVKRNLRFVHSYPSEVLWSPFFKLWHWIWRKKHQKS